MDISTVSRYPSAPSARRKKSNKLPEMIVSAMDTLKRHVQRIKDLTPAAIQVAALMERYADINPNPTIIVGDTNITLYCYPKAMSRIVDLMRDLRRLGFKGVGKFQEGGSGLFTVPMGQVYIYAQFGSLAEAKCKRVKVGTKEVDVYEVQCSEPTDPDAVSAPAAPVVADHSLTDPTDQPVF